MIFDETFSAEDTGVYKWKELMRSHGRARQPSFLESPARRLLTEIHAWSLVYVDIW